MLGSKLSTPANRSIIAPPDSLNAINVTFPSQSGSTIHAWYVPGQKGKGGVVLAHGVRANRTDMIERATFLSEHGYTVLLFDAQAHGESPGNQITFGYLEALDAHAAVEYLMAQIPSERIGYIGVSLGGAAALLSEPPLPLSALVLEAVYPTIEEAISNRIAIRLGESGRMLSPLFTWQLRPRLGVGAEDLQPIKDIAKVSAPILILAGENDRHTSLEESKRLFNAAQSPKEMYVINGAAHQDFLKVAPTVYKEKILKFLSKHINTQATQQFAKVRDAAKRCLLAHALCEQIPHN
ncbi:esterase/lipase/thioesterase family protein [gamma proteobacterium HTCC5015]|nr:esterase/lipase/thioesterase family protein [gamma proteobacterium HTCC5015]